MAKTLSQLVTEVLYRLGDSTSAIWSKTEVTRYLNEGYERLAQTGILWDMVYLEDQSYAGSHTTAWETSYFPAGWLTLNRFNYTADWEVDYVFPGQINYGPANHTTLWEYDNGYHPKSHFLAVHQIPAEVLEIERAVWNKRRIEPLRSKELEFSDGQYQTQQGEVLGYIRDKDGIRSFRKWRIPSSAADEYTVTGYGHTANYTGDWEPDNAPASFLMLNQFAYAQAWEKEYVDASLQALPNSTHTGQWEFGEATPWGLLRDPSDISAETVYGLWGICRRIPGEHPSSGDGTWGAARRVYQETNNTKIEYTRKGATLVNDDDAFAVPDRCVKYIRHFAMYRALERNGNGQDLQLAGFWKGLWQAGVLRTKRRQQSTMKTRIRVMGEAVTQGRQPPLARLPWQYGRVMR